MDQNQGIKRTSNQPIRTPCLSVGDEQQQQQAASDDPEGA